MGEHPPVARDCGQSLDQRLQVADLFLRGRRLLEFRRRRSVRLHDQPSDCALLRARVEPHSGAWSYRAVWCVRHAWIGAHAVLPACITSWTDVEGSPPRDCVLVHPYWTCSDDYAQQIADWPGTSVGVGGGGNLVCAVI